MEAHNPYNPQTYTTTAAAGGLIAAGRILLCSLAVVSSAGARRYLQFFDAAGLPPDGSVPTMVRQIEPNAVYEWQCGGMPRGFGAGCVWAWSSTGNIHTLANPECWLEAQFFRM